MGSSLNLSLTDELRAFVDRNCGDGTCYSTPSEFVRDLLRRTKMQQDAAEVRGGILEGYQDAVNNRLTTFNGDLQGMLKKRRT